MGFPIVKCVICGNEVSKRSTLALAPLDGREGRACRNHPELMDIIRKKIDEAELCRQLNEAVEKSFVAKAVELIKVYHMVYGGTPELIYFDLRRHGIFEHVIQAIKAEIEKSGPGMTGNEFFDMFLKNPFLFGMK